MKAKIIYDNSDGYVILFSISFAWKFPFLKYKYKNNEFSVKKRTLNSPNAEIEVNWEKIPDLGELFDHADLKIFVLFGI